jgi:predicted alpha-1,6-mannanase (GH76 family)
MINTSLLQEIVRTNIDRLAQDYFPDGVKSGKEWKLYDDNRDHLYSIALSGARAGAVLDIRTQEGLSFVSLVQRICNLSFPEAGKQIASRFNVELEEVPVSKPAARQHARTHRDASGKKLHPIAVANEKPRRSSSK